MPDAPLPRKQPFIGGIIAFLLVIPLAHLLGEIFGEEIGLQLVVFVLFRADLPVALAIAGLDPRSDPPRVHVDIHAPDRGQLARPNPRVDKDLEHEVLAKTRGSGGVEDARQVVPRDAPVHLAKHGILGNFRGGNRNGRGDCGRGGLFRGYPSPLELRDGIFEIFALLLLPKFDVREEFVQERVTQEFRGVSNFLPAILEVRRNEAILKLRHVRVTPIMKLDFHGILGYNAEEVGQGI